MQALFKEIMINRYVTLVPGYNLTLTNKLVSSRVCGTKKVTVYPLLILSS
jgi:hypothetical protein